MDYDSYEVGVIGAGIVGCSTAYHLAKAGKRVVLLEQFPLPHSRGSSHGQTRIFRHAYPERKYSQFMPESLKLWREIEAECGSELLVTSGCISLSSKHNSFLSGNHSNLKALGLCPSWLDSEALKREYPMLSYDPEIAAVYEAEAGVLMASKCLLGLQNLIRHHGGVIRDQEPVTKIVEGNKVTVVTPSRQYVVDTLVVTPGAYSAPLLAQLGLHVPVKAEAIKVFYWPFDDQRYTAKNGFPIFIDNLEDGSHIYGIPSIEYPNLIKICLHNGIVTTPQLRSAALSTDTTMAAKLAVYIKKHFSGVGLQPAITEECLYGITPDSAFIIDFLPSCKNIVIGAGFSGHGFKMAPVVGKILAEMASGRSVAYDVSHFRLSRFEIPTASL